MTLSTSGGRNAEVRRISSRMLSRKIWRFIRRSKTTLYHLLLGARCPLGIIAEICGGGDIMAVMDKLRGEFIDIIEWTEPAQNEVLAYRFPRYENEIKMGAKLVVREGQNAVFVMKVNSPTFI